MVSIIECKNKTVNNCVSVYAKPPNLHFVCTLHLFVHCIPNDKTKSSTHPTPHLYLFFISINRSFFYSIFFISYFFLYSMYLVNLLFWFIFICFCVVLNYFHLLNFFLLLCVYLQILSYVVLKIISIFFHLFLIRQFPVQFNC